MRRFFPALLLLALVTTPHLADAQQKDRATRSAALKLGAQGMALFDDGKYQEALEAFQTANKLVNAVTLTLRIARCLDKLNRLLEAVEVYRETLTLDLGPRPRPKHLEAKEHARKELAALLPNVPTIRVVVRGSPEAMVEINGEVVDDPSQPTHPEPGRHRVSARAGERVIERKVELVRGQHREVLIELGDSAKAATTGQDDLAPAPADESIGPAPVIGWVLVGVGAGALVMGGVTAGIAGAQQADLEEDCPNRQCTPDWHSDAQTFNDLRIVSTVGFIGGGVLAAAGVLTLTLTLPSKDSAITLQPGGIHLAGSFE